MKIVVFVCLLAATCLANEEPEKRIVNGDKAGMFSHPHQASLQVYVYGKFRHYCGAVLIGTNKLLTAAHCLEESNNSKFRVEVGTLILYDNTTKYEQTVPVRSFIMHENYYQDKTTSLNDIALLYLEHPVKINPNVQIARLAPKDSSFANSECVLTGWGRTDFNGPSSPHLMEVKMNKITTSQCQRMWPRITKEHICVYEASAKSGSCKGDSGGPMMCGPNKEILAGISSFTAPNCDHRYPSVYTRVSEYLDWIEDH